MMKDNLEEFGKRLKKIRESMNMTQEEFADELGMSESFIREIELESGESKAWFNFFKSLIDNFKVNPKYLFTGQGDMFCDLNLVEAQKKDYGESSHYIHRLLYYIENSPRVKYAVIDFFIGYLFSQEDPIKKEIAEYQKSKVPHGELEETEKPVDNIWKLDCYNRIGRMQNCIE